MGERLMVCAIHFPPGVSNAHEPYARSPRPPVTPSRPQEIHRLPLLNQPLAEPQQDLQPHQLRHELRAYRPFGYGKLPR